MSGLTLAELVNVIRVAKPGSEVTVQGDQSVEIDDVHHDSRQVGVGSLFCCVPGDLTDGHDHARQAVAAGAVALLCERLVDADVPQVLVDSVRESMGVVAAAVHGYPARQLRCIGITGTNGKTTTVGLVTEILKSAGHDPLMIGTLTGARTTPEAPDLQRQLSSAVRQGKSAVVMEVSSHALAKHRVNGMRFDVAVFTNLSPDHLDFHGSMEEYFRAKAVLFEPEHSVKAAVNLDDPRGHLLFDAPLIETVGFRRSDADPIVIGRTSTEFRWHERPVTLPLIGLFNVENALGAATAASLLGIDDDAIVDGLEAAPQVRGRFEVVAGPQPFTVVVDFAHTPDGLRKCLEAARQIAVGGRVIVVFGAGGNRDAAKRPLMGMVVAELADIIIITNDNPRYEVPQAIADQVAAGAIGVDSVTIELDRRAAIASALGLARDNDIVVIAGKGHETAQIVGDDVMAFDDREVAAELLSAFGRRP